jgi:inorganic pyrophosphatase
VTSFVATDLSPVRNEASIERVLKVQIGFSTLLMTLALLPLAYTVLPAKFIIIDAELVNVEGSPIKAIACVWSGLWAGCVIGFVTEYYTSHTYAPTREVAQSCETGAATNIIFGLALGYKSVIVPVLLLSSVVYFSFSTLDMYGVALAALGMLSTLATCLSIDVYGPVCDNAGGIAEMAGFPEEVREKTDALDAAGNTTAAIGKGFAIGSACLVGLALFGAFVKRAHLSKSDVSILSPIIFAMLLIGAMVPYWFTAMTMKSVGQAAKEMVKEVKRQFDTIPGLLTGEPGHAPADYNRCVAISTQAALREMVPPAILIMSGPLIVGILFGTAAVAGFITGCITSSVQLAIAASNTGGAWDNAKKFIEKGGAMIDGVQQRKGSDMHKAAVVGDTVGDPLKDTSGPSLNIVMKLTVILALVFADFFRAINGGHGLFNIGAK